MPLPQIKKKRNDTDSVCRSPKGPKIDYHGDKGLSFHSSSQWMTVNLQDWLLAEKSALGMIKTIYKAFSHRLDRTGMNPCISR